MEAVRDGGFHSVALSKVTPVTMTNYIGSQALIPGVPLLFAGMT